MTAPTEDLIERLEAHVTVTPQGDGANRLYRNPDGPAAAQALRSLQAEVERMRGLVADFVRCEDDAKQNPAGGLTLGGLMDCRANTGEVYQSADLAEVILRARSALNTGSGEG